MPLPPHRLSFRTRKVQLLPHIRTQIMDKLALHAAPAERSQSRLGNRRLKPPLSLTHHRIAIPQQRLIIKLQGLKEKSLVNETLEKVDALKPIADKLGATLAQLGLAWCVANEHCSTVIMGATKEHQVCIHIHTDASVCLCPC